jgi:hypothetical protein
MMMMTTVSAPTATPSTALPMPTPTWQDAKSTIAGAKEPATRSDKPLPPFDSPKGDSYVAGNSNDAPKSLKPSASPPPEASKKKNVNWPLVGGIVAVSAGAVALVAYLAKGGEKNMEGVLNDVNKPHEHNHEHPHGDGKAPCTDVNCSHDHH